MRAEECEIIEMYGILAERTGHSGRPQTLDLNLIRLHGIPVYDLRWWEEGQPMHGLSLTERTLADLGELISEIFKDFTKEENDQKVLYQPLEREPGNRSLGGDERDNDRNTGI